MLVRCRRAGCSVRRSPTAPAEGRGALSAARPGPADPPRGHRHAPAAATADLPAAAQRPSSLVRRPAVKMLSAARRWTTDDLFQITGVLGISAISWRERPDSSTSVLPPSSRNRHAARSAVVRPSRPVRCTTCWKSVRSSSALSVFECTGVPALFAGCRLGTAAALNGDRSPTGTELRNSWVFGRFAGHRYRARCRRGLDARIFLLSACLTDSSGTASADWPCRSEGRTAEPIPAGGSRTSSAGPAKFRSPDRKVDRGPPADAEVVLGHLAPGCRLWRAVAATSASGLAGATACRPPRSRCGPGALRRLTTGRALDLIGAAVAAGHAASYDRCGKLEASGQAARHVVRWRLPSDPCLLRTASTTVREGLPARSSRAACPRTPCINSRPSSGRRGYLAGCRRPLETPACRRKHRTDTSRTGCA